MHLGSVQGKHLLGESCQVKIKQLSCLLGLTACIDPQILWDLVLDVFHDGFENMLVNISVGFEDMEDSIQRMLCSMGQRGSLSTSKSEVSIAKSEFCEYFNDPKLQYYYCIRMVLVRELRVP